MKGHSNGARLRRRPLSLRTRMGLASGFWLLIALGSVFAVSTVAITESLEGTFQTQLGFEVDSLIAALEVTDDGELTLSHEPANPLFSRPYSGWYWQISHDGGVLRSRSLWDGTLAHGKHLGDEGALHTQIQEGSKQESLQIVERDVRLPDFSGVVHVSVAADRHDVEAEQRKLLVVLGTSLGLLGIGLLATIVFEISYVMRPLRVFAQDLEALKTAPNARLAPDQPRELAPLAQALNEVLDHDAHIISNARAHVGNLAHGLKTPLSVLQAAVHEHGTIPQETATAEIRMMRRLVDRHLMRARSAAGSAVIRGLRTPVAPVVQRLKTTLGILYPKPLTMTVRGKEDIRFAGDADDLMEILGNLMDNACKWAHGTVRVSLETKDQKTILLSVEDDGPGLPPSQEDMALRRGARLDDTVAGHGLGLDIVRDLVSLYGGTIDLETSADLGGLKVTLRLPG